MSLISKLARVLANHRSTISQHPGIVQLSATSPIAKLQLARASAHQVAGTAIQHAPKLGPHGRTFCRCGKTPTTTSQYRKNPKPNAAI